MRGAFRSSEHGDEAPRLRGLVVSAHAHAKLRWARILEC
jgi:hypothetical protein